MPTDYPGLIGRMVVPFLLVIMIACGNDDPAVTEATEATVDETAIILSQEQFTINDMALDRPQEQRFQRIIQANGYIDLPPQNRAEVSTPVPGLVGKHSLIVGSRVRAGQGLLSITNPDFIELQQQYLETKAQLVTLAAERDRQRTLADEEIAARKQATEATSAYEVARARLAGLAARLRLLRIHPDRLAPDNLVPRITLYAPISGTVTALHATYGSYVAPDEPLLQISNTDHVHLELQVYEKDIMAIKEGMPIRFRLPQADDRVFQAEVYRINQEIDPQQRTVNVHGHLRSEGVPFITGMYVEAEIIAEERRAPALPTTAVVTNGDRQYVLVLTQEQANEYYLKALPVAVGARNGAWVELLDTTVLAGRPVLSRGAFSLIGL